MRLLFLAHRVPDRPTKGDKIRAWHEIRALAVRHEVHLFAPDDALPGDDPGRPPAWADEVASATVVALPRWPARLRALRALVGGGALTAAHFAAPELRRALRGALAQRRFDAAVVYSGAMDPLLGGFRPRVVDLVDVDSEKFRLYHANKTMGGLKGAACGVEWRRLRALEKSAAEQADATVLCTDDEAATLLGFCQPRRLEVIGNGVDLASFPFQGAAGRAAAEVLFVGALDYQANVDACFHLVQDLLPRIRARVPAATVTLVGSAPTRAIRELASLPGVTLHQDVPTVLPFLHRATLALLPFRVARGIQNKALEALATGLPLVASRETAKGLVGVAGRDYLTGGDADELAAAASRVLTEPGLAAGLARSGRTLVESRYAWKGLLDRFVALVEETAALPVATGSVA